LGKTLYFIAGDFATGGDLWRTDGTPRGTRRVKEIPRISWSNWIHGLVTPGNRLAFFVDGGISTGLWTSDGTEAGTVAVRDFVSVTHSARLGEFHLFVADDGIHGHEWWRSDGTPQGTRMIRDLVADGGIGDENTTHDSLVLGDHLYFTADDGIHGKELWRTDGTTLSLVRDLSPGTVSSDPGELTAAGGRLWFSADDGVHGRELWSTDGTPAGTLMTVETMTGPAHSSPAGLIAAGKRLFYAAESPGIGVELHVLDLTTPKLPAARGVRSPRMAALGSLPPDEEAMLRSAFNLPAGAMSRVLLEPGTGSSGFPRFSKAGDRFRVEFLRRRDGRYRYTPKCSVTLEPDSFVPMSTEESVTVLDDLWERVVASEAIPTGATRMFGVVEVTAP
jgi:ELWxxDGT repeat protein